MQGEELKKLIGSAVYIECSSKTQQVYITNRLSCSLVFAIFDLIKRLNFIYLCRTWRQCLMQP